MSQPTQPTAGLVVYAKDVAKVVPFYRDALGFQEVESDNGYVRLRSSSWELVVVRIPDALAASIAVTDPPEVREDTAVKPVFVVSDLAAVRAAAAIAGGGIKPESAEWHWKGGTVVDGFDPEGNVLQVRQPEG